MTDKPNGNMATVLVYFHDTYVNPQIWVLGGILLALAVVIGAWLLYRNRKH